MNFNDWKEYFQRNEKHFSWLELDNEPALSVQHISTISDSIAQFQKGENSEGRHLIEYAENYGNEDYIEAIKSFIREEQRHANVLGQFMNIHKIPLVREHWIDSVFRRLRTLAGLENSITVLVTAEIIAAVYYKALKECTPSPALKAICERILIDEEMHINFQAYTIKLHYSDKNKLTRWLSRLLHRTLMAGTTLVVWGSHRKVLIAGGYTPWSFIKDVFLEFRRMDQMIVGKEDVEIRFTPANAEDE